MYHSINISRLIKYIRIIFYKRTKYFSLIAIIGYNYVSSVALKMIPWMT